MFIRKRGNSASCDTDKAKLISIRVRLEPGDPGASPKMRFCLVPLGRGALLHVSPQLSVAETSKPVIYQGRFTIEGPGYSAC